MDRASEEVVGCRKARGLWCSCAGQPCRAALQGSCALPKAPSATPQVALLGVLSFVVFFLDCKELATRLGKRQGWAGEQAWLASNACVYLSGSRHACSMPPAVRPAARPPAWLGSNLLPHDTLDALQNRCCGHAVPGDGGGAVCDHGAPARI